MSFFLCYKWSPFMVLFSLWSNYKDSLVMWWETDLFYLNFNYKGLYLKGLILSICNGLYLKKSYFIYMQLKWCLCHCYIETFVLPCRKHASLVTFFYCPWRVVTKCFFTSCTCDLSQLDTSANLYKVKWPF